MDELRAAVLRVQLRKLPAIIHSMRRSKYRIRRELEKYPEIRLRMIPDPAGDTGAFLIVVFPDSRTAEWASQALRAEGIATSSQGINNVVMTNWGLHIYSNIVSLVNQTSNDKNGFPWALTENRGEKRQYGKGTCPVADSLFERSVLFAIPSRLTENDEEEVIVAFRKVLDHLPTATMRA